MWINHLELLAGDASVTTTHDAVSSGVGGGLAARAAQPDWIATADLTLHVAGAVTEGAVEARARVAHAGRTTVVIEVRLLDLRLFGVAFQFLQGGPVVDRAQAGERGQGQGQQDRAGQGLAGA